MTIEMWLILVIVIDIACLVTTLLLMEREENDTYN